MKLPHFALLWAFAVLSLPVAAHTQNAPSTPAKPYSAEPIVIRRSVIDFAMKADGTGTRTETFEVTLQSEAALRQYGVVGIGYASASDKAEFLYVRVHHADGTVVETPLDGVQDQPAPVTREAPFYSDLKLKQLPVKGMRMGDTLEWQSRLTMFKAEAPNQFWGNLNLTHDVVTLDQSITLHFPDSVKATVWTNPASGVKPEESTANGEHIYTWTWKNLKPTAGPEADAAAKAKKTKLLTPEEEKDQIDGKLSDIAWTTFPSWEAVGAWYRSLEADRMVPDETIKAKVAEITAGKTTEEEKVRAVYAWVSGQIRYIGVAFGIGRFQPHTASAVLDNQYGDCKDKHTLLASMLTALGLHPDAVLIGADVRFNEAVPSPSAFNHLITRVHVGQEDVWLDSTGEVAPYRELFPSIRDHQALVIPEKGPASVQRTPAGLPFTPYSTFAVKGSLDSSLTSDSTITMVYRDDTELYLRAGLRQVNMSQYTEAVQRLMAGMGFGGTVSDASIDNLDDSSKPLGITFKYHRVRNEEWGENRIVATFTTVSVPAVDDKEPPVSSILLGTPRTETSTTEMKLPEGWSAVLPEAVHAHSPYANCDVTYRLDKGTLYAERKVTVLKDKVLATEWKQYKQWYDDAGASGYPYIQLVNASGKLSATSEETAPDAETLNLLQKAWAAMQRNDLQEADADLASIKVKGVEPPGLWALKAARAIKLGDQKEAMADDMKETELHPQLDFAWQSLVQLQNMTGERKAATETLQRWVMAVPTNTAAATALIAQLLDAQNSAAALSAANEALKHLPKEAQADEHFQLQEGRAQLRGGAFEAGSATLTALIGTTHDPLMKNDASYELACARQQLALAESTERSVIKELSAETLTWTGDEAENTMRARSSLLTASWDTMGWILFQANKLTEAEAYIHAAWMTRQDAEVGEHLGDIAMARKQFSMALKWYRLSIAIFPPYDGLGRKISLESNARVVALEAKASKAKAAGGIYPKGDDRKTLQQMRTLSIPNSSGISSTTEFRLLISPSGFENIKEITGVKDVSGKDTTKSVDMVKSLRMQAYFPPNEDARLLLQGFLNCHTNGCDLLVQP